MSYFIGVSYQDNDGNPIGTRSRVWDGKSSMPLGYPAGWRIELKNGKASIKGRGGTFLLSASALSQATAMDVSMGRPGKIVLTIRPRNTVTPVFSNSTLESETPEIPAMNEHFFRVTFCRGKWGISSEPLTDTFIGKAGETELFSIERREQGYILYPYVDGIVLQREGQTQAALRLIPLWLESRELLRTTFTAPAMDNMSWKFNQAEGADVPWIPERKDPFFRHALNVSIVTMVALFSAAALWPGFFQKSPKTEEKSEIVAEQFSKIVPARLQAGSQRSAQVQAYRSQGFSHSLSQLMKGGMTKLLAESEIGGGDRLLQVRSGVLHDSDGSTANVIGLDGHGSQKIAAIGAGFGGGGGVGYGKGEHAGVLGQGHAFVAMDNSKSTVEEGLTRDEVGEVIHQHISEVRYCYESSMLRLPSVEGKLLMGFTITGSGAVRTAEVKSSTLADAKLDDCILRRLVGWKFPNTKGGVDVAVSYPFIFKTLGG